jgi:hypothetical protein
VYNRAAHHDPGENSDLGVVIFSRIMVGRVSGRIGQLTGAGSPAAILRIAAIVAATALR